MLTQVVPWNMHLPGLNHSTRPSRDYCGKYRLTKFANFLIIVLRAEIATIFEPKVVAISARNTTMRKFANFVRLYFPHITTFFNQILGFYNF